jgi:hypothetical protein
VKFLLDHNVPDDLSYLPAELNHDVTFLRKALPAIPPTKPSSSLPTSVVVCCWTCNRNDFLHLRGHIMASSL